ncbi:WG repeat-containing protein [Sediminibacterium sp.]|uniref:WG repeat-containing protein n=1 Tax=Sediminibacterium sp. TaxID=1917865 RepID=UPI003F700F7B
MKKIKIIIVSLTLWVLSITACNNAKDQSNVNDSSYTMEEQLEIARLAAQLEGTAPDIYDFQEGKAIVISSDSIGFIRLNGQVTYIPELKELQQFSNGLAAGITREDIPCYVDSTGKIVKIFPDYQSVYDFGKDDITVFLHKNDKFGLMDKSFKELIPAKYNQTSFHDKGLFVVEYNGKWGAVDRNDKTIIPFEYESLGYLDDAGMILATQSSLSGFIDQSGKVIVPLTFYNLFPYQENFARFIDKASGKYGVIDRKGNIIVQPKYNDIGFFKNGLAIISNYHYQTGKGEDIITKRGYIDTTGKEFIPLTFTIATDFEKRGLAFVQDSVGDAYIDRSGKRIQLKITQPITKLGMFNHGFARIELGDGGFVYLDGYQRLLKKQDIIRLRDVYFK